MAYPTVRAPRDSDKALLQYFKLYFLPRRSAPKWQSAEKRCAGHEPRWESVGEAQGSRYVQAWGIACRTSERNSKTSNESWASVLTLSANPCSNRPRRRTCLRSLAAPLSTISRSAIWNLFWKRFWRALSDYVVRRAVTFYKYDGEFLRFAAAHGGMDRISRLFGDASFARRTRIDCRKGSPLTLKVCHVPDILLGHGLRTTRTPDLIKAFVRPSASQW